MKQSGVIKILKTFTPEEIDLFSDYLKSPFHNKNLKAIEFFEVLKKYYPEYNEEKISKESLFKEMFGSEKFRESYIRNLFSDLNILAEKFIQINYVSGNQEFEKTLIEGLWNRNLIEAVSRKLNEFERKTSKQTFKDQEYYSNKMFIYNTRSLLLVDKTLTDNFRKDQILSMIKRFLIDIIELNFYLIIEEQRVQVKHDFEFLKNILGYVRNHLNEFKESHLILIYFYLAHSFLEKENSEQYYFKAKEIFKKNFAIFPITDKKNIYSMLQAYCCNKMDDGVSSYNYELLSILLEMLKSNVISHSLQKSINLNLYRNIVIHCLNLEEVGVLKKFIRDYAGLADPNNIESLSDYSNAHLSFLQQDFEKAIELASRFDFKNLLLRASENVFFKRDIKKLILKCHYELNSIDSAFSAIDAYKHFLADSKLIKEDVKQSDLIFISCVNSMLKLKIQSDGFKLAKLKEKIKYDNQLNTSSWISRKITELK